MSIQKSILWFRQDLRLHDNAALCAAVRHGAVLPLFILEDEDVTAALGGAGRWWLHHSLAALKRSLGDLHIAQGEPAAIIADLAEKTGATAIFWNRRYEPDAIARDTETKAALSEVGLATKSFSGALLTEPWAVKNRSGQPFKVYSPFWRALQAREIAAINPKPETISLVSASGGLSLSDIDLLPTKPNWTAGWETIWSPGEDGARERLAQFLDSGIEGYATLRDRPDLENVSHLSPHLHFGEVSPATVWWAAMDAAARNPSLEKDGSKFRAELAWREFSHHLLYHFPKLPTENWKPAFDAYPWVQDETQLTAWQKGKTGYPLVDAGMRELWQTGYMHNRVRMVVASFLIKHLRHHWKHGERWFRDTLVDADLANNSASWQWVAGSGADAAPYFRIFNPTTQGEKFDPDGAYVRKWCPELARLPDQFIYKPHTAPPEILNAAGVRLGVDYPLPIVDHAKARQAALDGLQQTKHDFVQ
ncbi:MAG: deoxyribodipyrimidine photo-lyase [Pseudomonadota bacterium]